MLGGPESLAKRLILACAFPSAISSLILSLGHHSTPFRRLVVTAISQIPRDEGELLCRRLQILGDLGGDDMRLGEVGRILQAIVLEPQQVKAHLVPLRSSS